MGLFGWDYPAGAANDPNAPFNQIDPPDWDYVGEPRAGEDIECPGCTEIAKWDIKSARPVFKGWICNCCGWSMPAVPEDYNREEDHE